MHDEEDDSGAIHQNHREAKPDQPFLGDTPAATCGVTGTRRGGIRMYRNNTIIDGAGSTLQGVSGARTIFCHSCFVYRLEEGLLLAVRLAGNKNKTGSG